MEVLCIAKKIEGGKLLFPPCPPWCSQRVQWSQRQNSNQYRPQYMMLHCQFKTNIDTSTSLTQHLSYSVFLFVYFWWLVTICSSSFLFFGGLLSILHIMSSFVPPFDQVKVDQWCLIGCRCKGTTPGEGQVIAKAQNVTKHIEII